MPAITMCQGGRIQGSKLLVSTPSANMKLDKQGCTCRIYANTNAISVITTKAPNYMSCGSAIDVTFPNDRIRLECFVTGTPINTQIEKNGSMSIVKTRNAVYSTDYCVLISTTAFNTGNITIECEGDKPIVSPADPIKDIVTTIKTITSSQTLYPITESVTYPETVTSNQTPHPITETFTSQSHTSDHMEGVTTTTGIVTTTGPQTQVTDSSTPDNFNKTTTASSADSTLTTNTWTQVSEKHTTSTGTTNGQYTDTTVEYTLTPSTGSTQTQSTDPTQGPFTQTGQTDTQTQSTDTTQELQTPVFADTTTWKLHTPVFTTLTTTPKLYTPVFTTDTTPKLHTPVFTTRTTTPKLYTPVFTTDTTPKLHTPVFTTRTTTQSQHTDSTASLTSNSEDIKHVHQSTSKTTDSFGEHSTTTTIVTETMSTDNKESLPTTITDPSLVMSTTQLQFGSTTQKSEDFSAELLPGEDGGTNRSAILTVKPTTEAVIQKTAQTKNLVSTSQATSILDTSTKTGEMLVEEEDYTAVIIVCAVIGIGLLIAFLGSTAIVLHSKRKRSLSISGAASQNRLSSVNSASVDSEKGVDNPMSTLDNPNRSHMYPSVNGNY
ncbi:hypothetical protein ScPMuIL_012599 [Solemya velum]